MKNRISILLFFVLLVSSIIPSSLIFYIFEQMITTQEQIYKNNTINSLIDDYEITLKKIAKLDPEKESLYKEKFLKLQDQKLVYGQDNYFSEVIKKAITKSFLIYLGVLTFLALFLGFILSYLINKIYLGLFSKLEEEKERSRYLKEIAKWQEVAKNLAHEVKKPLQPIRFWLSHLRNLAFDESSKQIIYEAVTSIESEIKSVLQLMDNFKDFSSLPKPNLTQIELNSFVEDFFHSYKDLWENVSFNRPTTIPETIVNIDTKLIRNVFVNIIENASEANLHTDISMTLAKADDYVTIEIHNTGLSISEDLKEKIFEINFSTKTSKKNMGLGLAIVKTTILEHDGDIKCVGSNEGVTFLIRLPLYTEGSKTHV